MGKEWNAKQLAYRAAVAKKEADKKAKALKKQQAAAKAEVDKKNKEAELQKKREAGDEVKEDEVPAEDPLEEQDADEGEENIVDFDDLDVFGVDDVRDVGGGMPLFKDFVAEDWTMLHLRFELYLLTHAFRRDVDDPERTAIFSEHLQYYYQRYFKKDLTLKAFGVENIEGLIALVDDTVQLSKGKAPVIETIIEEELESFELFVKITEEARRDRDLRIDAGDASAKLNLQLTTPGTGNWNNWQEDSWGGSSGGQRGGNSWEDSRAAQRGSNSWGDSSGDKRGGNWGGGQRGGSWAGSGGAWSGSGGGNGDDNAWQTAQEIFKSFGAIMNQTGKGGWRSGPYGNWGR